MLGLCCCTQAFSSCREPRQLLVVVHRLLIAVASFCLAQAVGTRASVVKAHRLGSCGSQVLERTGSVAAAHGS